MSFETSLAIAQFRDFKLSDLFNIYKCNEQNATVKKVPLISATALNNGVKEYIETDNYVSGNKITISCNGSCGDAFYQSNQFSATSDVAILAPKFNMDVYIALFICTVISLEKFKYSYGRKYTINKVRDTVIKLPVKNGTNNLDYDYMREYIKGQQYSSVF